MKILILSSLFYPSKLGGPANTYYWLSKALVRTGLSVTVVASKNHIENNSTVFDEWTSIDGIKVRYCTANGKIPIRIIKHTIKEMNQHDIVMLGSVCYIPNFYIILVAIAKRKKIIWSTRGELFNTALGKGVKRKAKILYFKLLKLLFAKKVIFHATSYDEKKIIHQYFGEDVKSLVIPNYMELPEKQTRDTNEKFFLFAGRINPIKAIDNLLLGLSQSKEFLNSKFKLYLAGLNQECYQQKLEEIINTDKRLIDRVLFLGNQDKDSLDKLFSNAHFLFLISHSENFGNVVIEALSQDTPVVASFGTPWGILEEYKAGFWIDNNPKEISKVVSGILNMSEKEYNEYRESAGKLAKQFDVFDNIDKWIEIYKNLLDDNTK